MAVFYRTLKGYSKKGQNFDCINEQIRRFTCEIFLKKLINLKEGESHPRVFLIMLLTIIRMVTFFLFIENFL
jgi:hypothetical protein